MKRVREQARRMLEEYSRQEDSKCKGPEAGRFEENGQVWSREGEPEAGG